jgi:hypothetical protein
MISKGSFVQIEKMLLSPEQRAPQVPDDTKKTPYMLWINGFLLNDANMGDEVEIKTLIGRIQKGKLVDNNVKYSHDFGNPIVELLEV